MGYKLMVAWANLWVRIPLEVNVAASLSAILFYS